MNSEMAKDTGLAPTKRNVVSHSPQLFYLWGERGEVSWLSQLCTRAPIGVAIVFTVFGKTQATKLHLVQKLSNMVKTVDFSPTTGYIYLIR